MATAMSREHLADPPPLLVMDTETTSTEEDRQIWEIGVVHRLPWQRRTHRLLISDVDLSTANEDSLRIGRFDQRHPLRGGDPGDAFVVTEVEAAHLLYEWTAPVGGQRVHVIGCVPDFDTSGGARLLKRHGLEWRAHYHKFDVENAVVGYLAGMLNALAKAGIAVEERHGYFAEPLTSLSRIEAAIRPPWNSEDLSRAVGVEPPGPDERHTALGDAVWAEKIWDVVTATPDLPW
jgi:hypothetical protein